MHSARACSAARSSSSSEACLSRSWKMSAPPRSAGSSVGSRSMPQMKYSRASMQGSLAKGATLRVMPAKGSTRHPASGFDVAVIGGGVIGLSVAWRARARGMSVVVLDRGELGAGTTRVAAGMLAPASEADPQERALLALGLESARLWGAFADELRDVCGLDVGLRTQGTLAVARDGDEKGALERELDLCERLGLRATAAAAQRGARAEPALAPSIRLARRVPRRPFGRPARARRGAGGRVRSRRRRAGARDRGDERCDDVDAAQVVLAAGRMERGARPAARAPGQGADRPAARRGAPGAHAAFRGRLPRPALDGRLICSARRSKSEASTRR